jgi:hypothetical protein
VRGLCTLHYIRQRDGRPLDALCKRCRTVAVSHAGSYCRDCRAASDSEINARTYSKKNADPAWHRARMQRLNEQAKARRRAARETGKETVQ